MVFKTWDRGVTKDADPWKVRNKWSKPYVVPPYYLKGGSRSHPERERVQVECIQLLKLRSYSWESEETRAATVHRTEYQRGKSGTEITTDIYWVSLLSSQLSTDQCLHVHWSETTWGQRKKSPKRMREYQCPANHQG